MCVSKGILYTCMWVEFPKFPAFIGLWPHFKWLFQWNSLLFTAFSQLLATFIGNSLRKRPKKPEFCNILPKKRKISCKKAKILRKKKEYFPKNIIFSYIFPKSSTFSVTALAQGTAQKVKKIKEKVKFSNILFAPILWKSKDLFYLLSSHFEEKLTYLAKRKPKPIGFDV